MSFAYRDREPKYLSTKAGEALPNDLSTGKARQCTVHGIRHHIGFARSPEVSQLAALPGHELFARARNARLIMSDEVPDEMTADTSPYCIHYPHIASEDTYRTLARRYPAMRYQVGRACAVAGYVDLYRELDLLPDVSIAEEARENRGNAGAQAIFAEIMAAPLRYRVMDDYTRTVTVDAPEAPARLNGETLVVGNPEGRVDLWGFYLESHSGFDITEDGSIGTDNPEVSAAGGSAPILTAQEVELLYSPLPFDLPTMHKTALTLYAAYNGDVDRWDRLRGRRTWPLKLEDVCLARGCQFNTPMAMWLAKSPHILDSLGITRDADRGMIKRAINARFLMDDSFQHLLDPSAVPDKELPYWIWYPDLPHPIVVEQLATARPAMRPQCVRACIAGNWRDLYDTIMGLEPQAPWLEEGVMNEAKASPNPYYLQDLQHRVQDRGYPVPPIRDYWKEFLPLKDGNHRRSEQDIQDTPYQLFDSWFQLDPFDGYDDPEWSGFWEEYMVGTRKINRYLTASDAEREEVWLAGEAYDRMRKTWETEQPGAS
jgi:hypothetical protein